MGYGHLIINFTSHLVSTSIEGMGVGVLDKK